MAPLTVTMWTTSTSTRGLFCRWQMRHRWQSCCNCTRINHCIRGRRFIGTSWFRWRRIWRWRLRQKFIPRWLMRTRTWKNWSRSTTGTCSRCSWTWFRRAAKSTLSIQVTTSSPETDSRVSSATSRHSPGGSTCSSSPLSSLWSQLFTSRLIKSET